MSLFLCVEQTFSTSETEMMLLITKGVTGNDGQGEIITLMEHEQFIVFIHNRCLKLFFFPATLYNKNVWLRYENTFTCITFNSFPVKKQHE